MRALSSSFDAETAATATASACNKRLAELDGDIIESFYLDGACTLACGPLSRLFVAWFDRCVSEFIGDFLP